MKIAITGHSKGIGKGIADYYSEHEVIGFSRSNGYDISKLADIQRIVTESADADVFVNNAYHTFYQCTVLDGIFELWQNDPTKTIVNIVSRAKYGLGKAEFYKKTKQELFANAKKKMFSAKKCRIININPGYVETDMVEHVRGKVKMLTTHQLAELIAWTLSQPQNIEIGELSVWLTSID